MFPAVLCRAAPCWRQALRTLQAAPVFDRVAFERTVEGIRAKVAALLWHLVVIQVCASAHVRLRKG